MKIPPVPQPTAVSVATQNACNVCMPLGACLAYRGIEGAMPFLHGPQGCATYIRRFLIGHFREPMDIACSSFNEESAIFGGGRDLSRGLENVGKQYQPSLIGIASTCLAETIGDDLPMLLRQYKQEAGEPRAELIHASTPSYRGTHADGFHAAVYSLVKQLAFNREDNDDNTETSINVFSDMLSPADLRHLHEILKDMGVLYTLLPDYSETLDRPVLSRYERLPEGGTPIESIRKTGSAIASVIFSHAIRPENDAAIYLEETFGVPLHRTGIPIGINATDRFFAILETLTGLPQPAKYRQERGRLVDAYVDGHKYLFNRRVAIVADEDLAAGIAGFVSETGARPVVCATGGRSGRFSAILSNLSEGNVEIAMEDADFSDIESVISEKNIDLIFGSSRCAPIAARQGIPLIRTGMPIHDRIGAQRLLHVGYRGAQALFDTMVNTFIQRDQDANSIGYMTM